MERRDGCQIKDDPIGNALRAIEGKWKIPVMYVLCKQKSMRYSELRKALDITNMMLTSTLKELEADGLVSRVQYNEVPPRVEYSATKNGKRLMPALKEIRMWGESLEDATDSMRKIRRELPAEAGGSEEDSDGNWRFRRNDGTQVCGTVITDPMTGERTELPRWELIHGAWWCFGADGNLKTGLIYDQARQGWFYMDRNNGMKTGWARVNGEWRYFERSGPSTQGRMVSDTWIGGWYVNENGVWDGKKEQDDRENPGQEELDNGSEISREATYEHPVADLSEAISTARVYRNMTQKELAERTGINQADVSKLEKGTRNPSIAILKRIAEGLDMELHIQFIPKKRT